MNFVADAISELTQLSTTDDVVDIEAELYSLHVPRRVDIAAFSNNGQKKLEYVPQKAMSQPRRARARLPKKAPKVTDFFKKK
ncbi:hypothetical protein MRB53_039796 [Persea americana]|nr:hypothetical protein MRB53_039796 [Persea americana]